MSGRSEEEGSERSRRLEGNGREGEEIEEHVFRFSILLL